MVWGRTHTGAPVPLDPDIVVIYDAEGVVRQGRVTHFASCPHAETHRRRTEADR
jgi:hypothetical protein